MESVGEILDGCLRAKLKEALEGTAKRDGQTMERLAARHIDVVSPLLIRLYGLESNTRRSGKLALREAASFAQAREIGFGTPVSCEHVIESFAKDADVGLMKRVVELDYVAKG